MPDLRKDGNGAQARARPRDRGTPEAERHLDARILNEQDWEVVWPKISISRGQQPGALLTLRRRVKKQLRRASGINLRLPVIR